MTVAEVIRALQQCDPSAHVVTPDYDGNACEVEVKVGMEEVVNGRKLDGKFVRIEVGEWV